MAALNPVRLGLRLRWRLARSLLHTAAGPLAFAVAAGLMLAALAWQQRVGARVEAQQASVPAPLPMPERPAGSDLQRGLREFNGQLPAADGVAEVVQSLIALAEARGLRLMRGNYRHERDPAARLARFHMILPLRGDPAKVQQFVQDALLAHPTLAIEGIEYQREDGASAVLQARVQWVLFVRADPPPAGAVP